jgi:hypothetical protein
MSRRAEGVLYCIAFLLLGLSAVPWLVQTPAASSPPRSVDGAVASVSSARPAAAALTASAQRIASTNPFRLSRQPAVVRLGETVPSEVAMMPAEPPPPPRPQLVLAGITGGPPWEALVEGIPGHTGAALLREGEEIAGVRAIRITADSAALRGADTAWTLALKRLWP